MYRVNDPAKAAYGTRWLALGARCLFEMHSVAFKHATPYVSSMSTLCAEMACDAVEEGSTYNLRGADDALESVHGDLKPKLRLVEILNLGGNRTYGGHFSLRYFGGGRSAPASLPTRPVWSAAELELGDREEDAEYRQTLLQREQLREQAARAAEEAAVSLEAAATDGSTDEEVLVAAAAASQAKAIEAATEEAVAAASALTSARPYARMILRNAARKEMQENNRATSGLARAVRLLKSEASPLLHVGEVDSLT
jgi:hypothetical protein